MHGNCPRKNKYRRVQTVYEELRTPNTWCPELRRSPRNELGSLCQITAESQKWWDKSYPRAITIYKIIKGELAVGHAERWPFVSGH